MAGKTWASLALQLRGGNISASDETLAPREGDRISLTPGDPWRGHQSPANPIIRVPSWLRDLW
jgi:hypothetical protein